jgi:hypothetical protein
MFSGTMSVLALRFSIAAFACVNYDRFGYDLDRY